MLIFGKMCSFSVRLNVILCSQCYLNVIFDINISLSWCIQATILENCKILKFHFPIEPHVLNFVESENKYIKKHFSKKKICFLIQLKNLH